MVSVRNPLAGFGITILGTVALSFLVGIPILFLPRDLAYFYFPFVLFAVGVFAGRTTFIGSLGFMGALIGGIVGVYAFQALFLPAGWPLTAGVPVWLTGNSFITSSCLAPRAASAARHRGSSASSGSSVSRTVPRRCADVSSAARRSACRPASAGPAGRISRPRRRADQIFFIRPRIGS